jgi:MFS superfamily sulfate permease-like transporter
MPQPVLAAVVIAASLSLLDVPSLRRLFDQRRSEFWLAIACALGVALVGVLEGIVIAVFLSIMYIFAKAWSPYSTVLGKPDGVHGWHDVTRYPSTRQEPGLIILRWAAPLFFANANVFRNRIRELVADAETRPEWVIVAGEPITDIDTTAGEMLHDLDLELNDSGIHLAFAELPSAVVDHIRRYGLLQTIDEGHIYSSVTEAVREFKRETGRSVEDD